MSKITKRKWVECLTNHPPMSESFERSPFPASRVFFEQLSELLWSFLLHPNILQSKHQSLPHLLSEPARKGEAKKGGKERGERGRFSGSQGLWGQSWSSLVSGAKAESLGALELQKGLKSYFTAKPVRTPRTNKGWTIESYNHHPGRAKGQYIEHAEK